MAAMQQQLNFIAYIQRMLNEGDFSATYKFALLHALADVCVESVDLSGNENQADGQLVISLETLAEKLILLYWHHATPFSSHQGEAGLLRQNTGAQSKVITVLYECQQNEIKSLRQLKNSQYWKAVFNASMETLKNGPLWRLQILAKQEECFLYPHNKKQKFITLYPGIADCFRRFYDLVVYLARNSWIQKIQAIKFNQQLIGPESQLERFLFGFDRTALNYAKPVLIEIQQNRCFYCHKPMVSGAVEVDHFIPFARYAHDLGHNFVAAHRTCNNNKRDFLAAHIHKEHWQAQNLEEHADVLQAELGNYYYCDSVKSKAVSDWAYQVAELNGAKLWLGAKDKFVSASDVSTSSFSSSSGVLPSSDDRAKVIDFGQAAQQRAERQNSANLPYFPNLKIACGHFKSGDDSEVEYIPAPDGVGKLDPKRHFLARASGNSMNGGKNPILDGDLLLLEWITPERAGSLQNCTVAIECDDETGTAQYLLRDIKKEPDGRYKLIAKNQDYEPIYATEQMRTFARLKSVIYE
ncbi:S24 family peptidase [Catenovulum sediminis]|uniref:S24 family peptidase n=1 Tax=Catenovulum sediminis TaxID=1740262 RepID=A0ABV1RE83_9ALTE